MSKYHHLRHRAGLIIALLLVAIFASCTKDFQKINATPNASASATFAQLYQSIGTNLDLTAQGEDNAGTRWLLPITQQGAVYAASDYGYGGGANWTGFYQNLAAINQMFSMVAASPDSATYTNAIAMLKTLRAYQAIELSNFYGDIPFSKAGKGLSGKTSDLTVPYDKQQQVYLSCLADLTWAVNHFTTNSNQYSLGSSEFLLANNIPQWIKFANSLRLRYALTMYDKDNTDAAPIITDALTKPLLSDEITDVVGLNSTNIPGLGFDYNAAGRGFAFRQECRIRMGSTMWNMLSNNNNADGSGIFDPRAKIYFEVNGAGDWAPYPQNPLTPIPDGGDPYNQGRDNDWASATYKGDNLYSDFNYYWGRDGIADGSTGTVPEIFITPAEVHFLKAEVYARGIGAAANMTTAQTEYEAGVTSSLTFWMTMANTSPIWVVNKPATAVPTASDISTVLTNPKVAFNSANATSLIYAQEWVDLFRQPWVAWTLMRRTGGATPADQTNPAGYAQNYGSLQRYQYPGDEQLYNNANWKAATGGNDVTSTKLWITK